MRRWSAVSFFYTSVIQLLYDESIEDCNFFILAYKACSMARSRNDSEAVDAFSAPKELLALARRTAIVRGMTKSGLYRYCLAKEVGYPEEEAMRTAQHPV